MEELLATVVLGTITGLGYGLLSVGMVIVYRTNRIVNFAHGEVGAFAAALLLVAVKRGGVPYYVSLPLALAAGAALAAMVEIVVIRRLRNAPRLMSLVATLGLGLLLFVLTPAIASASRSAASFPDPPGMPGFTVGPLIVDPGAVGLLFFSPFVILGLTLFLRKSRFGLALRGAAANPEAARMSGVFASRMSALAWAIGGALSTFTAILVAPSIPGGLLTASAFGSRLLTRGLAGAIIARMSNIPVALAAGIGIGVVEGLLLRRFRSSAVMEIVLFGIILIALLAQAKERLREGEKGSVWASVQPWRPISEELNKIWLVRNLSWVSGLGVLALLAIAPLWLSNVKAVTLTSLLCFGMVALSVGIITGLGGQLTLGQFALAAVGAVVSAHIATRTGGNPLSILAGGVAAAAATLIIGVPALRVKGMFLAVTTLSLAVAMSAWILHQPWALGDGISSGTPSIAGRLLTPGRSYYYFALVVFLLLFLIARNVRTSGFGRLLTAVRDNEDAARAFGLHARRIKIQGFLLAGFLAGVGGAAYGHSFSEIVAGQFDSQYSLDVVLMTVIGGIGSLIGPLLGVFLVKGMPALLPVESLVLFTNRVGLLFLIMYFPGGLVQMVAPLRLRVINWIARLHGVIVTEATQDVEAPTFPRLEPKVEDVVTPEGAGDDRPASEVPETKEMLRAIEIGKSYGGLSAVNDVSLSIVEGETLGLIGPNGAGKTTLFEVLAGFTTADHGRIFYQDTDVTSWSPEKRAEAGLIRSFQDVVLFPTMTVLETVQLSLERRLRTTVFGSVLGMRSRDRRKEKVAREVVGSMGLWAFRNKQIQELSTGTRRITELACLISLRPKLLLLDEPSSGIAQRETEALGQLLEDLKSEHEITLLVIEHDIPMIMSLADRIIAMDAGAVIATGSPSEIRNDQRVVEAYLGGRLEAIERSGILTATESSDGHPSVDPSSMELTSIPGLGPARQAALLEAFGSVQAIRKASIEDLSKVPGVGAALAKKVHQGLRS